METAGHERLEDEEIQVPMKDELLQGTLPLFPPGALPVLSRAAGWLPPRRASRVAPIVALRE